MVVLLQPLLPTFEALHKQLLQAQGARWLIGGSCGLLLHNVDIQRSPRDLDLYVDGSDVAAVHASLKQFAVDSPEYNETPIYASILSHYELHGNAVEVVGDFRVNAFHSAYCVEAAYLWEHHSAKIQITASCSVKVMPLAHELLFNLLRDRSDRYQAIAQAMRNEPELHMTALRDLLNRHTWGTEFRRKLEELLQF
ncbi:hypothetical protein [Paenibacillus sp. SI8]|uniref:hypothetical protein n=1 Tax=unclassified Paenibacillus TaxID=185978 RepID=UPI00346738F0